MKTVRLKFLTDTGKPFTVSLNYAADDLTEAAGKVKVQNAMNAIIENQPFDVTVASAAGAELIDRNVAEII